MKLPFRALAARFILLALCGCIVRPLRAQAAALDSLAGDWQIFDAAGKLTGASTIAATVKGALLAEVRTNLKGEETAMWWVNSEAAGNWKQLIVGANGLMRETLPVSRRGEWPLVLAGTFTNPDGATASFRLSLFHVGADESKRKLETSKDGGATWSVIFDQTYRRRPKPAT
jgi:hypothetical protein